MSTTKEELKSLSTLILSQSVYNVMTALRGPDQDTFTLRSGKSFTALEVKHATTAVIRHAIAGDFTCVIINPDNATYAALRNKLTELWDNHFIHHAVIAFKTLGLKWQQNNNPPATAKKSAKKKVKSKKK